MLCKSSNLLRQAVSKVAELVADLLRECFLFFIDLFFMDSVSLVLAYNLRLSG